MKKVFVAARSDSRDAMLDGLRELGVMHLEPVDPAAAAAPEELSSRLARLRQARQVIGAVSTSGKPPEIDADAAAEEILSIFRRAQENRSRLTALHREADLLGLWGDLRREQLDALAEAGVPVRFFSVPASQLAEVAAECVAPLVDLPSKRVLVGVVQREGEPALPEEAEEIYPPKRDLHTVRAEAKEVDQTMAADAERLAALANLSDAMDRRDRELAAEVDFATALAGAMRGDALFAVQGWVPTEQADALAAGLADRGIPAAVDSRDPADEEQPPTLIQYPRWARPIKGLFDVLGTFPGYKEMDLSGFFMIALPLFAAMLIGDAGYGLLFIALAAVFYRKLSAKAGKAKTHLIIVVGGATLAWGMLTGNYFGISPKDLTGAGGPWAPIGNALAHLWIIGKTEPITSALMRMSFIFGTIHLTVAQLRQAIKVAPNLKALSNVGWAVFLWGMLGVVWYLFFGSQASPPRPLHPATGWLLIAGGVPAILFAAPNRNPAKMLGLGLANFPLAAIGTFSDTISYIRLMAVGLSSTIIAQTFNGLGSELAGVATWAAGGIVVLFGHGLNIALCMIAILAHGVRLNMLEFSNNAGVQWSGYAYEPFSSAAVRR